MHTCSWRLFVKAHGALWQGRMVGIEQGTHARACVHGVAWGVLAGAQGGMHVLVTNRLAW